MLLLMVSTTSLFFEFFLDNVIIYQYQMHPVSTQHGICTDSCFIMEMKSNCYEAFLGLKKPKTMDSSLINDYYRLFGSHGLLHFVLSVFIYMKCYFIQDFIVIKVR